MDEPRPNPATQEVPYFQRLFDRPFLLLIAGMLFTGYRALESLFSEDAGKWKQVGFGLLAVLILYNPNWPLKWLFGMGNVIPDTYIGLPFAGLS